MDLRNQHSGSCFRKARVFALALFAVLSAGCLDIPDSPNQSREIESISVYILQKDIKDSTVLRVHPNDSATLKVNVFPRQYKDELTFEWLYDSRVIGHESEYDIAPSSPANKIPNSLRISDPLGSQQTIPLDIVVNTVPRMDSIVEPLDGDTLYGNKNSSFLFKWQATDIDVINGSDKLAFTLVIDSTRYSLGPINSVRQSGFQPGKHTIYVVVRDSFGDKDSLAPQSFYVQDTLGGKL
jgi:hypothetical protein